MKNNFTKNLKKPKKKKFNTKNLKKPKTKN